MFVNVPGIVIVTCGFINHDEIDNALNVDVVVDHLTKEQIQFLWLNFEI